MIKRIIYIKTDGIILGDVINFFTIFDVDKPKEAVFYL